MVTRQTVKLNENKNVVFKNCSIDQLIFDAYIVADATNTSLNDTTIDYSKIQVDITLTQFGRESVIYRGQLKPLVFANAITEGNYTHLYDSSGYSNGEVILTAATSVYELRAVKARVALPGGVNLKDSDFLKVNITVGTGSFHANCDGGSYVICSAREAVVKQKIRPAYSLFWLEANKETYSETIGDNVTGVFLINTDKTSQTTTDQIFTRIELKSDRKSLNWQYVDAITERLNNAKLFNQETSVLAQSQVIHYGEELDGATLEATLVTANVNQGKNAIVVQRFITDGDVARRGFNMDNRHSHENLSKLA